MDAVAAVSKLAPLLLEVIGLAVAEVAEDEETNREWWVGETQKALT